VVRVSRRHAHCDYVRFQHLDLDVQFRQPCPVQKHGVGASRMTRQRRLLG
jgi:hypothetical protein